MIYAEYNEKGDILGFYDDDIHNEIPTASIQITEEQWQDCLENPQTRKVINGKIQVVERPKADLNTLKSRLIINIDHVAGKIRQKYIPAFFGQEAVYQLKTQEAQHILSDSSANAPLLASEASALGISVQQLAQTVLNKRTEWENIMQQIEPLRITGKKRVEAAANEKQAVEVARRVIQQLESL